MRKKNVVSLVLALALMAGMTGCGNSATDTSNSSTKTAETSPVSQSTNAAADESGLEGVNLENIGEHHYTIAGSGGKSNLIGRCMVRWSELLEEYSDGKVKVDVFWDGELNTGGAWPEEYRDGIREIGCSTMESATKYGVVGVDNLQVYSLPFLFRDYDHVYAWTQSGQCEEMHRQIDAGDNGVHVVGHLQNGARSFFTSVPVESYKDLAGLKIRVQAFKVYEELANCMDINPIALSFSEVYNALSTGMVDGAENPVAGYLGGGYGQVAPYFYESRHMFETNLMLISKKIWNELNEDEKALFEATAKMVEEYCHENIYAIEEDYWKQYGEGITRIVPTDQEREELFQLVQKMYTEMEPGAEKLVAEIRAIQ